MASRSENRAGRKLDSGDERFGRWKRHWHRSFGNPGHANSVKVYLGQVRLSIARRTLEILKEQGLQALVTQPDKDPRPARWYQLFRELPKDPWGNEYIYRSPGLKNPSGYDLYSAGADRQADTADDDWGGG